jgi:hypothetical protein
MTQERSLFYLVTKSLFIPLAKMSYRKALAWLMKRSPELDQTLFDPLQEKVMIK